VWQYQIWPVCFAPPQVFQVPINSSIIDFHYCRSIEKLRCTSWQYISVLLSPSTHSDYRGGPHSPSHDMRLLSLPQSFTDKDYTGFTPHSAHTNYNYLDPNFFPASWQLIFFFFHHKSVFISKNCVWECHFHGLSSHNCNCRSKFWPAHLNGLTVDCTDFGTLTNDCWISAIDSWQYTLWSSIQQKK